MGLLEIISLVVTHVLLCIFLSRHFFFHSLPSICCRISICGAMVGNPRDAVVGSARYCFCCKVIHTSSGWYTCLFGVVCRKSHKRKLCQRSVKVKCERGVKVKQDRHSRDASAGVNLHLCPYSGLYWAPHLFSCWASRYSSNVDRTNAIDTILL